MFTNLFISWWLSALRGFLAFFFGVLAIIWPQQVVPILVQGFGAFTLVNGIIGVIIGLGVMGSNERWWMALLEGMAGIIVGLLSLWSIDKTEPTLVYLIACTIIIIAVIELTAAIQLNRVIAGERAMLFCAIISLLLGIVVFAFPSAGVWRLTWLIGPLAIVLGVLMIVVAFRIRSLQTEIEAAVQAYRRVYQERRRLKSEIYNALSYESTRGIEC